MQRRQTARRNRGAQAGSMGGARRCLAGRPHGHIPAATHQGAARQKSGREVDSIHLVPNVVHVDRRINRNVHPARFRFSAVVWSAILLGLLLPLAGCTQTSIKPVVRENMSQEKLLEMAANPRLPFADRAAAARRLDADGRQKLESQILADLPEVWRLEGQHRIALLGIVGGARAARELTDFADHGPFAASERINRRIDAAVTKIESRLAAADNRTAADPR